MPVFEQTNRLKGLPRSGKVMSVRPPGICGPNVTIQFAAMLAKIQSDFAWWPENRQRTACRRILYPIPRETTPTWGGRPSTRRSDYALDKNCFDVLPLFQGTCDWLRSDKVVGCPCAIPSSNDPSADNSDVDAHEDPNTCCNSVQVGDQCWLSGTVNYGTFGIMVRLCSDKFLEFGDAKALATELILGYKITRGDDPMLPFAWFNATYNGGPSATPSVAGNRPQCKTTCPLDGSLVDWDYVWEPVKPREVRGPDALYSLPTFPVIK